MNPEIVSTRMVPWPASEPPPAHSPPGGVRPTPPQDPAVPTKVTITGGGVTVTVEAVEPLDAVRRAARAEHEDAHRRCTMPLPTGFGGTL